MNKSSTKKVSKNVILALVTAVILAGCDLNIDMTVNADGTGTYVIYESGDKTLVAESMGVPEEEVVSEIENFFEESFTNAEGGVPEDYAYEVKDEGENVSIAVTSPFTYDAQGWDFGEDTNIPNGGNVTLNEDGDSATFTFDTISAAESGLTGSGSTTELNWEISVTFPGEISESTGGGSVNENTVIWDDAAVEESLTEGTLLTATGSLSETEASEIEWTTIAFFVTAGIVGGVGGYFATRLMDSKKRAR